MKFAIVVLACLIAAAYAQYRPDQYFTGFNQRNQLNQYNSNPYSRPSYDRFSKNRYTTSSPYRPFATATPTAVPVTFSPVTVTTPRPVAVQPALAHAKVYSVDARQASTLKSGNEINPDGSYQYFFETDNGIAAQAVGTPRDFGGNPPVVPDVAQGSFSWYSPEGQLVSINYVADENGYQPQGDAIPTPPAIPPQIARALEYIARAAPKQ